MTTNPLDRLLLAISSSVSRRSRNKRAWLDAIPPGEAPPEHATLFGTHIALNKTPCPFTFLSDPRIPDTTRFDHGIMSWKTPDAVYTKDPGLTRRVLLNKKNPKSKRWYSFHHRSYNYRIPADALTYPDADDPRLLKLRQTYSSELSTYFDLYKEQIEQHIATWLQRVGLGTIDISTSIKSLNTDIAHLMLFGELPPNRWFTKFLSDLDDPVVDPKKNLSHLLWPFLDYLPTPYVATHRFRAMAGRLILGYCWRKYRNNPSCLLGKIYREGIDRGHPEFAWEAFPLLLMAINAVPPCPMILSLYLLSDKPEVQERVVTENLLSAVIKETLRLYPPVPTISRIVKERIAGNDSGVVIGVMDHAEDQFLMNNTAMHRDSRGWERADEFLIERWLPDWQDRSDPDYRLYIPFGLGARSCPGAAYATKLLHTFLSIVLTRRVVSNPSGRTPDVAEGGIRIVRGPLQLELSERILQPS